MKRLNLPVSAASVAAATHVTATATTHVTAAATKAAMPAAISAAGGTTAPRSSKPTRSATAVAARRAIGPSAANHRHRPVAHAAPIPVSGIRSPAASIRCPAYVTAVPVMTISAVTVSVPVMAISAVTVSVAVMAISAVTVSVAVSVPAAVVPWPRADEYSANEPLRSVVAIGSAGIRIIRVIAPIAHRGIVDFRCLNNLRADANTHSHLGLGCCS